jgi:hypothetical protein
MLVQVIQKNEEMLKELKEYQRQNRELLSILSKIYRTTTEGEKSQNSG